MAAPNQLQFHDQQQYLGGFTHAPYKAPTTQVPSNFTYPPPPPGAPPSPQQLSQQLHQGNYKSKQAHKQYQENAPQHEKFPKSTLPPPSVSGICNTQVPPNTQSPQGTQVSAASPAHAYIQSVPPRNAVAPATTLSPVPDSTSFSSTSQSQHQPGGLASRLNYKDWSKKFNKKSAEKIFNKENADKMMSAGKKYFSSSGKILDKVSAPVMPLLVAKDSHKAAAWKMQQETKLQKLQQQTGQAAVQSADGVSLPGQPSGGGAGETLGGQNTTLLAANPTTATATSIPPAVATVSASGIPQTGTARPTSETPAATAQSWQHASTVTDVTFRPVQTPGAIPPSLPTTTASPTTQTQAPTQSPTSAQSGKMTVQTPLEDFTPLTGAIQTAQQKAIASGQPRSGANEAINVEMPQKQQRECFQQLQQQQQQQQQQQSPVSGATPLPGAVRQVAPQAFSQSPVVQTSQPSAAAFPLPPMTLYGKPLNPVISHLLATNQSTPPPGVEQQQGSPVPLIPMPNPPSPQTQSAKATPLHNGPTAGTFM